MIKKLVKINSPGEYSLSVDRGRTHSRHHHLDRWPRLCDHLEILFFSRVKSTYFTRLPSNLVGILSVAPPADRDSVLSFDSSSGLSREYDVT